MELEKLKTGVSKLTTILEEEGIMSLDELRDMTNLEEKEVLLALDWLHCEEQIELLPAGNVVSLMLIF